MSGTNVYAELDDYSLWANDLGVNEFSEDALEFLEKIGEGQFGEVHLCVAQNPTVPGSMPGIMNKEAGSRSKLVAVKMLRPNTDHAARLVFFVRRVAMYTV